MRLLKAFFTVVIPLFAAGCATPIDQLKTATPTGSAFNQALTRDYAALAEFEQGEFDFRDAHHFARKGLAAAADGQVYPDFPEERNFQFGHNPVNLGPQFAAETVQARSRLLAALNGNGRTTAPDLASRAQVSYDCWIEQLEEGWQTDHIANCRRDFLAALEQVEAALRPPPVAAPPPPARPTPAEVTQYQVFFDWDRAELSEAAARIVADAATRAREANFPALRVIGHADRSGPADYNLRLSVRRAESVRGELVEQGVPRDRIEIVGRGEADPIVPTEDGVRQPQNRRAIIEFR